MTGEPGKPDHPSAAAAASSHPAKRSVADAEAALRQFELDESRVDSNLDGRPLTQGQDGQSRSRRHWFKLRQPISTWLAGALGSASILFFLGLWWFLTLGEMSEDRIVSATTLPSPAETFGAFPELWFERALTRNTWVTMRRVTIGFALAAVVGIPVGVLAGCFAPLRALLAPVVIFGRNIPLAALIPLTFFMFGIGEGQKIMFIFIACVAFVIADATTAIMEVGEKYVDTAFTLGASRWQTIIKVLFPLALPSIFNSLRLLFGLAFGYIMLAELIRFGDEAGGLGNLINVSQRRGMREHIYLIIIIIPVIALAIDRVLFWIQRQLFPHRYGSVGILNNLVRAVGGLWDDLKTSMFTPAPPFDQLVVESQTDSEDRRD